MVDDEIGTEPFHRDVGIAEGDPDHRHAALRAVSMSVRLSPTMIACRGSPPARSNRSDEMTGVGLGEGEAVAPADRAEQVVDAEGVEEGVGMGLDLVGADGQAVACRGQLAQGSLGTGKRRVRTARFRRSGRGSRGRARERSSPRSAVQREALWIIARAPPRTRRAPARRRSSVPVPVPG